MNFELTAADMEFAHLNVRSEKHGDDDVTAIDLKLIWTTSHDALTLFDARLARALYEFDAKQAVVEGASPVMTARAFPLLQPLAWKDEVTGLKLTIEHGLAGKSDLVLNDCTADHFVIEALDGGSVKIAFRLRTLCKDERILGKLGMLIKRDLPMTIEREHAVEGQASPALAVVKGRQRKGREPTAEDIFANGAAAT